MRWLGTLAEFPPGPWDGDPVIWITRGGAHLRSNLLRQLSGRAMGASPGHVQIARAPGGQPYAAAPQRLWLSSAGRDDWQVVAVARTPIGVDIETTPSDMPPPLILLHPQERASLEKLVGDACQQTFLRFWTAREAYWKSTGKGLGAALACCRAELGDSQIVKILVNGDRTAEAQTVVSGKYVAAAVQMGEE
jgi:phosphopantetheinyl transferase